MNLGSTFRFKIAMALDFGRIEACTRKARKLSPKLHESSFWEGTVQAAAGRRAKACEALTRFIDTARTLARYKTLIKSEEKRVHALTSSEE